MSKKNYLFLATLIVLIVATFSFSFILNKTSISKNNPLLVIDMAKKEVRFDKYPENIISLSPAATEIIYDIDKGNNLIAVDTFSNYPEDVKNKQKLETSTNLNIENILNLKPDVVFMSKMGQTIEQYNSLIDSGIKVVIVDASSINQTYEMINLIGKVLNKNDKSKEVIKYMENEFKTLSEKSKNKESKTVYFEVSPLQYGLWTSGNNTFENEIMQMLNMTNVFSDVSGWGAISEEQVLSKNPQYIVSVGMNFSKDNEVVNEIYTRNNWKNIDAIKNKNVYNINPDIMSRSTKRLVDGAKELYKIVYGD
jgi:iron complex transport system substrate-binding protein